MVVSSANNGTVDSRKAMPGGLDCFAGFSYLPSSALMAAWILVLIDSRLKDAEVLHRGIIHSRLCELGGHISRGLSSFIFEFWTLVAAKKCGKVSQQP
jgi:hypothetical protein